MLNICSAAVAMPYLLSVQISSKRQIHFLGYRWAYLAHFLYIVSQDDNKYEVLINSYVFSPYDRY